MGSPRGCGVGSPRCAPNTAVIRRVPSRIASARWPARSCTRRSIRRARRLYIFHPENTPLNQPLQLKTKRLLFIFPFGREKSVRSYTFLTFTLLATERIQVNERLRSAPERRGVMTPAGPHWPPTSSSKRPREGVHEEKGKAEEMKREKEEEEEASIKEHDRRETEEEETAAAAKRFRTTGGGSAVRHHCEHLTKEACRRANNSTEACGRLHHRRIIYPRTVLCLGDCHFLDACRNSRCKFVHYALDDDDDDDNDASRRRRRCCCH